MGYRGPCVHCYSYEYRLGNFLFGSAVVLGFSGMTLNTIRATGDMGGGNVDIGDDDTINGDLTNVGLFSVPGTVNSLNFGVSTLYIEADDIDIAGIFSMDGLGSSSGNGGAANTAGGSGLGNAGGSGGTADGGGGAGTQS